MSLARPCDQRNIVISQVNRFRRSSPGDRSLIRRIVWTFWLPLKVKSSRLTTKVGRLRRISSHLLIHYAFDLCVDRGVPTVFSHYFSNMFWSQCNRFLTPSHHARPHPTPRICVAWKPRLPYCSSPPRVVCQPARRASHRSPPRCRYYT